MKTPAQQTRNEKRKVAYAAMAGQSGEGRSAKRARLKRRRQRTIRTEPVHPCGNIGCARWARLREREPVLGSREQAQRAGKPHEQAQGV